ncbi:MAG: archaellin/type IV pilin N-terminal domain-containing protein [archaeon]
MNKRGISPIIATVLLVSLALILALIVFIWASSFIGEKAQKNSEVVANSCPKISFAADAKISGSEVEVSVQNNGNVPLYGVQISKRGIGSITDVGVFTKTIANGETENIPIGIMGIDVNDEVVIVPIILGKVGEATKSYTCEVDYGVVTTVKESA